MLIVRSFSTGGWLDITDTACYGFKPLSAQPWSGIYSEQQEHPESAYFPQGSSFAEIHNLESQHGDPYHPKDF